ncbi:hypothetical protein PVL29_009878 [Vitis rotundifolia]|uniref:Protein LURP-one-related 15 n=1 Tax=Vitis rotundifolia TaxID=103349 RepID=A0AA38ZRS6_VITRO|nr:hypothetical protein PVL29_009878 [Vitis rotundifolia]
MESSSHPPSANPVVVISPHFCSPNQVELAIVTMLLNLSEGSLAVTDMNGTFRFKVKGRVMSLRDRRILQDAAGNALVTLRRKIRTVRNKWLAFRGDSTAAKDLLFTTKLSYLPEGKSELNVFLVANTDEEVCDFEMHKELDRLKFQSNVLGKDIFAVTVNPNVDFSFIVALIVIMDETIDDEDAN